jgi:hypothetical protein
MRIELHGSLINDGFSHISKAGIHLFVNCKERYTDLNSYCQEDDRVTFWFHKYLDEEGEIIFHCETEEEKQMLADTQMFMATCKEQWEFLFVKFEDLK